MRAVWLLSFMSKFQQIVDHVVPPSPPPPRLAVRTAHLWSFCQSGYLLPEVLSLPRCSQSISFEMTHKESIENDHNGKWESQRMSHGSWTDVGMPVLHIRRIMASYQMGGIIAAMFRCDNHFLESKRETRRGTRLQTHDRSAPMCQTEGLQAPSMNRSVQFYDAWILHIPDCIQILLIDHIKNLLSSLDVTEQWQVCPDSVWRISNVWSDAPESAIELQWIWRFRTRQVSQSYVIVCRHSWLGGYFMKRRL